jgi:cell wall-associated NlpC family hydrolase
MISAAVNHPQPRGLSRRRVEQLLSKAKHDRSVDSRIEILSRAFLGHSYKPNPLTGSADTEEVFTAALDGFDCVTYIETVVALARASKVDEFTDWLRKIRYEQGRIQWDRRNHYMSFWVRNNVRNGILKPVSMPAVPLLSRDRILNVIPGLDPQRTRLKCVPKAAVPRLERHLQSGDLIFFASTRRNLDVFHAGIIVRDGKKVLMRHASRSQGSVVEQELSEFLKENRMAGVIVVRPQPVSRRIAVSS